MEGKTTKYGDEIVFPLAFGFDDYENNNPLGSHKGVGKCGAAYLNLLLLPPEFQSKIENNFLFILFNTRDRQIFTNKVVMSKVIDELNFLQKNGITISLSSGNKRIYFVLMLILGDNLGVHSILGLNESFRSNLFCRFCLTLNENINMIFKEKNCELRTVKNYNSLLAKNNKSLSGIKEDCVFHSVDDFHMTKNLAVDVMHDMLEGVW